MLDQSFSYENFRILQDVENRKGRYLEDMSFFKTDIFKESRELSKEIIKKNDEIRKESKKQKAISDIKRRNYTTLNKLEEEKKEIKIKRELCLEKILKEIGRKTDIENYKLKIKKGQVKWDSQLYEIEHTPENYFVSKQLQRNINKTFKVKQANRKIIIDQLRLLFDDGFPKIIIRTDIKEFYESILHDKLLSSIEENTLLSYPSKKIIKNVLNQYWKILIDDGIKKSTDKRCGIPRGIGFSAYLSELYLRAFDKKVTSLENTTYYSRYVDDIIIIITPPHRRDTKSKLSYKNLIKNILLETTNLRINESKTTIIDLTKRNNERKISKAYKLTYLGYKFKISYTRKQENKEEKNEVIISKDKLAISMSDNKLKKYQNKIKISFENYKADLIKYSSQKSGTERMLYKRIKFLTTNHQLVRRKSNVFIGIYFSNEFLTNPYKDLIDLDRYLKNEISQMPTSTNKNLLRKLKRLSFINGFKKKRLVKFNTESFKSGKIVEIWKNL